MATNFNINPYYDDFDESKGYHRILFRPGYAVQARELTQLQTQLQDQINKFGKHVFVNGTLVLGGGRTYQNDVKSIKLQSSFNNQSVIASNFQDLVISNSAGSKAIVKLALSLTADDPITLIIKEISGGEFSAGETITAESGLATYNAIIQPQEANPINDAAIFSIDSGIFFVDGKFVYSEAQSYPVDKYSNTVSKSVGFLISEQIVTSDDDASLLDRAQDTPNFAAPGADRYSISLDLMTKEIISAPDVIVGVEYEILDLGNSDFTLIGATENKIGIRFIATSKGVGTGTIVNVADNFIELARVVQGSLVVNRDKTIYTEIGSEFARRTYDESGDYTVKKWPIQILDDETNPNKFIVALDPGKGYIKGYEFETINQQFLSLDRARRDQDVESVLNVDTSTSYGNYVFVNNLQGLIGLNPDSYESVNLRASSTIIGTANIRRVQHAAGISSSSATSIFRVYLFNIKLNSGRSFTEVTNIANSALSVSMTIDQLSKIGGTGGTILSGMDSPGLIFNMPNSYIKSVSEANFQSQITRSITFANGIADATYTSNAYERFIGTGALSDSEKEQHYIVIAPNGSILDMSDANGGVINVSEASGSGEQRIDISTTNSGLSGGGLLIANVTENNLPYKTKTLSVYKIKVISNPQGVVGGSDSLGIADIYDVAAIYNTSNTNPTGTVVIDDSTGELTWNGVAKTDVTSRYIVDNGQRLEFYDHGSIILNGAAPANTDYLLVVYRNYTHSSGGGFFSVDSYPTYDEIPVFEDSSTGEVYNLRDCIDFRPKRADNALNYSFQGGLIPNPTDTFDSNYDFYLSRIDKVIATSDKTFVVQQGIPALYPTVPTDLSNGMTLYIVVIPPYTADVSDISIKYIENKRYTMRDIGRLEKRINNLEYYTQLSLLEKQAKDTSIPDASNFEKFKNGFAVDPFTSADIFVTGGSAWAQRRWGWWNAWFNGSNTWNLAAQNYNANSIAFAGHPDFNAAIDPINQELRAPFTVEFHEFDTGTLTNTNKEGDLVSLAYTEEDIITQTLATTYVNINPFNVIRFFGSMTLQPAFDQWVDTKYLPAVNKIVDVKLPDAADKLIQKFTGSGNASRVTSRTTTVSTNVVSSTTTSLGANVVDIQFVPFMRANTVIGTGDQFKPFSKLYAFLENTSVDQYIKPLTLVQIEDWTTTAFQTTPGSNESLQFRTGSRTGTSVGTAKAAIYSDPDLEVSGSPATLKRLLTIYDDAGSISVGDYVYGMRSGASAKITAVTTYNLGDALIPDQYGNIGFQFNIPEGIFKTGERTIRLINNNTNDIEAQDSISESKYTAIGQLQTKQETILTTRALQRQKVTVETRQRYRTDPTAQTFFVEELSYPQGFHVSSVDVYFRTKSNTVPVALQIRTTSNGYPSSNFTIPFAESVLNPSDISISEDGSAATTFTFPNPIHLGPGEYAIVLLANSPDYEVFVAEMGQSVLGGTVKVDKQPYIGSLFKSQNASTWTADQNQDLKFVIRRAKFNTSGNAVFNIKDPEAIKNYHTMYVNTSSVTPTGTDIRWYARVYDGSYSTSRIAIDVNQDIEWSRLLKLDQQAQAGGDPTLIIEADLFTSSDTVSPLIDASSMSVVAAENTINSETYTSTSECSFTIGSPIITNVPDDAFRHVGIGMAVTKTVGSTITNYGNVTALDEVNNEITLDTIASANEQNIALKFSLNEELPYAGGAFARYITKPINLADGFDATNINVTVDINRNSSTDVKVYYRTLATGVVTSISDESWNEMVLESTVPSSTNDFDFKEYRYFPAAAFDSFGIPNDLSGQPRFNTFQIKIVMLSDNRQNTPKFRDLRIIALDS